MRSKLPFHRQETPSSCAVACLRMILEHHGFVVSTSHIPYTHTVIVESYEGDRLLVVDPLAEPKEIRLSEFLESWAFYDNMAVVLRRR
jgi:ABC-type bacteriocin/lantibiotic exporter with double-glycine peptidase domain